MLKLILIVIIGLGINIYSHLLRMGNDPRCMIGFDTDVKMAFFLPVIILAALSVVLMTIVHCNISTPALRKASFIEDQVIIICIKMISYQICLRGGGGFLIILWTKSYFIF